MQMRRIPTYLGVAGLAVLFWLFVALGNDYVTVVRMPLRVVNLPITTALATPLPETVEVTVSGNGWQLLVMSLGSGAAFELPGNRIHADGVILTNRYLSEALQLPAGMKALQVYPETLRVEVDVHLQKKVPIRLALGSLTFKQDFGLTGAIVLSPDSILLTGAEKVLRGITSWPTARRSYEELSLDVSDEVPLADSLPGVVRFRLDAVKVYIPVEQLADASFRDVPVQVRDAPPNGSVLLVPPAVEVFVRGGVNRLSQLTATDFTAAVDYRALLTDSSGAVQPAITTPPGVTLLKTVPETVRAIIRR
jgi:YbbR domain-containing protein